MNAPSLDAALKQVEKGRMTGTVTHMHKAVWFAHRNARIDYVPGSKGYEKKFKELYEIAIDKIKFGQVLYKPPKGANFMISQEGREKLKELSNMLSDT